MKNILDIVIINWNSTPLLQRCVASISSSFPGNLIIVDNGSANPAVDALADAYDLNLLRPSENLGFGGGCNLGAAQGYAPFILFLNPDICFHPDTLPELISFLTSERLPKEVGIVGVQLVDQHGQIQKNIAHFPRFSHLFPRMLGLDRAFPCIFPPHYVTKLNYEQTQIVDQVPGAFFLVRRSVFDQLGGFDERFFMYYEDVDFSYRAFLSGWKTLYLAEVAATHQGGGTTYLITARRLFYSLRSRVLYIKKHGGIIQAVLVTLGILLLEFWARLARAFLKASPKEITATIKAYALFIRNIPGLFKRK